MTPDQAFIERVRIAQQDLSPNATDAAKDRAVDFLSCEDTLAMASRLDESNAFAREAIKMCEGVA